VGSLRVRGAEPGVSHSAKGSAIDLGDIRQKSGKRLLAWVVEGDLDPKTAGGQRGHHIPVARDQIDLHGRK